MHLQNAVHNLGCPVVSRFGDFFLDGFVEHLYFCAILNDITCYTSYMYARSLSCILWFCSGLSKFLKLATTAWFIVYFILHEHNFESPLGVNHGNSFILLAVD